ncbi:hypothetical protein [uncultured Photobacterium sp.]|uniref:hypothetical protein n=1 Tax=uncultured Photobacterium sp. TaxID=173973 RepID=UPI0026383ED6|nr:hypothetical protein [uncultured Photobacterium sp.]
MQQIQVTNKAELFAFRQYFKEFLSKELSLDLGERKLNEKCAHFLGYKDWNTAVGMLSDKTANPLLKYKDRLITLMCASGFTTERNIANVVVDIHIYGENDFLGGMNYHSLSREDASILGEVLWWLNTKPEDKESSDVMAELRSYESSKPYGIKSTDELFEYYTGLGLTVTPEIKRKAACLQLTEGNIAFVPFPHVNEEHCGVYGHHVIINGKQFSDSFIVNTNNHEKKKVVEFRKPIEGIEVNVVLSDLLRLTEDHQI